MIKANEVMLIDNNGEKQGIVTMNDALEAANKASLDLVQVSSPDSEPVVCKLLDFGKFQFEKKKSTGGTKKPKKQSLKEIKFRPGTEEGDYQVKLRNLIRFLKDGDKAKVSLRFRGRELAHQHLGQELMSRIREDLAEYGSVEQEPKMEGRQIVMVLGPAKKR